MGLQTHNAMDIRHPRMVGFGTSGIDFDDYLRLEVSTLLLDILTNLLNSQVQVKKDCSIGPKDRVLPLRNRKVRRGVF